MSITCAHDILEKAVRSNVYDVSERSKYNL